jgi:hypothetical protein
VVRCTSYDTALNVCTGNALLTTVRIYASSCNHCAVCYASEVVLVVFCPCHQGPAPLVRRRSVAMRSRLLAWHVCNAARWINGAWSSAAPIRNAPMVEAEQTVAALRRHPRRPRHPQRAAAPTAAPVPRLRPVLIVCCQRQWLQRLLSEPPTRTTTDI